MVPNFSLLFIAKTLPIFEFRYFKKKDISKRFVGHDQRIAIKSTTNLEQSDLDPYCLQSRLPKQRRVADNKSGD